MGLNTIADNSFSTAYKCSQGHYNSVPVPGNVLNHTKHLQVKFLKYLKKLNRIISDCFCFWIFDDKVANSGNPCMEYNLRSIIGTIFWNMANILRSQNICYSQVNGGLYSYFGTCYHGYGIFISSDLISDKPSCGQHIL